MKDLILSIDSIMQLESKGNLYINMYDACEVARKENMFYRTNELCVVRVIHNWTRDTYGFAVVSATTV